MAFAAEKGQFDPRQHLLANGRHFTQFKKPGKRASGAICQFNTCAVVDFDASALGIKGVSMRPTTSPITRPIATNIGEDHFMADPHFS
jgi:hypothetical protein